MKKIINAFSGALFPAAVYILIRNLLRDGDVWENLPAAAAALCALIVYIFSMRGSLYRFLPLWKRILRLLVMDGMILSAYFAAVNLMGGERTNGMVLLGAAMAFGAFYAGFFVGARDSFERELDRMDGPQFEQYCADILRWNGFRRVSVTQASNDYGADIVAFDRSKNKWVIQCKHYEATLGVSPVQEVKAAMNYYDAQKAAVMTSSGFSRNAVQLAEANEVVLIDREELLKMAQKR